MSTRGRTSRSVSALLVTVAVATVAAAGAYGVGAGLAATRNASASTHIVSAGCSSANARRLVDEHQLDGFMVASPVAQLLCGPFTGPGSNAMAIVIGGAPTCWPFQRWAVFSYTGSLWKLVLDRPAFLFPPLAAVGSGIRETTPVYRPGDPRCIPSGGSHARIWRWNGSRLVAGAWRQVTPPTSSTGATLHVAQFVSPSRNIVCQLGDEDEAHCVSASPPHGVSLSHDGRLRVCSGTRCVGSSTTSGIPTLAYGQQNEFVGYRCRSEREGVTCTDIRSGKGFLINRDGIRRIAP